LRRATTKLTQATQQISTSSQQSLPHGDCQQTLIRLQCDGKGIDHISNLQNIPISGMYIEIHNSEVKIAGSVMGFDGDWKVTREDKATIGFSPVGNARYYGWIN